MSDIKRTLWEMFKTTGNPSYYVLLNRINEEEE